jgi:NAD(P)-dependent dehydrogenase (short-subunit alcohol dehydrogenase family)
VSAPGFTVPSQIGRRAIVTGTGGLGYETALALAGAGADVVLAGRNPDKGAASVSAILRAHPSAAIRFEALDLASLASVAAFAERTLAEDAPLHLLVNNAGVMALPRRRVSADGFELQFATNYLGHFPLTARLLPRLMATPGARVVSLGSLYAGMGSAIDFEDLQAERAPIVPTGRMGSRSWRC